MTDGFSDYLVFVDESGDHGLDTIDPGYPVFVLAFCVINKADYVEQVVSAIQRFSVSSSSILAMTTSKQTYRGCSKPI